MIKNKTAKTVAMTASLMLLVGVGLGAFGSHGLNHIVPTDQLPKVIGWWQTATQYLFVHALGVLAVAMLIALDWCKKSVAICLIIGTVIFSGSLYLMGLGFPRWLGAITPIGGTLLMIGWGMLSWQLFNNKH